MVEMLKREFDNSVVLDKILKQLLQRFEYDHANEPKSFIADFFKEVWMDRNRKVWEFQFKRLFFLSFLLLCLDLCLNHCLDLCLYMVRESG